MSDFKTCSFVKLLAGRRGLFYNSCNQVHLPQGSSNGVGANFVLPPLIDYIGGLDGSHGLFGPY